MEYEVIKFRLILDIIAENLINRNEKLIAEQKKAVPILR